MSRTASRPRRSTPATPPAPAAPAHRIDQFGGPDVAVHGRSGGPRAATPPATTTPVAPQAGSGQDAPPAAASREPAAAPAAPATAIGPRAGRRGGAGATGSRPAHGPGRDRPRGKRPHHRPRARPRARHPRAHGRARGRSRARRQPAPARSSGHLTIRVTMTDGVMQASIIADRPEAARMLQQSIDAPRRGARRPRLLARTTSTWPTAARTRGTRSPPRGHGRPGAPEARCSRPRGLRPCRPTTRRRALASRLDILA